MTHFLQHVFTTRYHVPVYPDHGDIMERCRLSVDFMWTIRVCTQCLRSYQTSHGCLKTDTEGPIIFSDNTFVDMDGVVTSGWAIGEDADE